MSAPVVVTPHEKDLGGGFVVRRSLPDAALRAVGPFIFFDHFGPVVHRPSDNFDVRPHPHIGLATVTYLFEGAMLHRDNLGSVQRIEPGAINWMTAGCGIAHSERSPADLRATPYRIHGLQLWTALPQDKEECPPAFQHTPASAIPEYHGEHFDARVLIGEAFGLRSPVNTYVDTLYVDFDLMPRVQVSLPAYDGERALYSVSGAITIDGITHPPCRMVQIGREAVTLTASAQARCVLIGGAPLDAHRFMWWNFVSSRKERIEEAKADWKAGRFAPVPGETEFIPLPE